MAGSLDESIAFISEDLEIAAPAAPDALFEEVPQEPSLADTDPASISEEDLIVPALGPEVTMALILRILPYYKALVVSSML